MLPSMLFTLRALVAFQLMVPWLPTCGRVIGCARRAATTTGPTSASYQANHDYRPCTSKFKVAFGIVLG